MTWLTAFSYLYGTLAGILFFYSVSLVSSSEMLPILLFLTAAALLVRKSLALMDSVFVPASIPFACTAVLVLPLPGAIIVDGVTSLMASISLGRPLDRHFVNFANGVFPAGLAGLFLSLSGARDGFGVSWSYLTVSVTALAIHYLANLVSVSFLVSLSKRKSPLLVLQQLLVKAGTADLSLRLLALLASVSYAEHGPITVLLLFAVIVFLHHSTQLYVDRETLTKSACCDGLTEVGNRHAWNKALEKASMKEAPPYLLALFDLNGMKEVNDLHGHEVGDQVLRSFADFLAHAVGRQNVYRFGGDEFVVLIPRTGQKDLRNCRQKIASATSRFSEEWAAQNIAISASFGLHVAESTDAIPGALQAADRKMYKQKRRDIAQ